MMKKHQSYSYTVAFCRSNSDSSSSAGGNCSDDPSVSPAMERKEKSSMDPLIKPRRGSNISIVKKSPTDSGDECASGGNKSESNCPSPKMEDRVVAKMRNKFRGCLLGALVGDCIGTLFERDYSVSYTLLEELYHSLTNLSEDEKLMDLHGIDSSLEPKRVKEILETKRQSYSCFKEKSLGGDDEDDSFLKPFARNEGLLGRRGSAMVTGSTKPLIPKLGGGSGSRRGSFSRPIERYSDDTVMTKSVLHSLINCKGFDARHMARQMTEDYFLNMNRKFGGYIRDIFVGLRENGYQDPFAPAKKLTNVIGAQGNEAASRASPIALFCCAPNELQLVVDLASKMSKITNANKQAVLGTVLQALAIHVAFNWEFLMEATGDSKGGGDERTVTQSSSPSPRHSPLVARRRQSQGFGKTFDTPVQNRVTVEQQPKYFCEQVLEKINAVEGRSSSLLENLRNLMHQSVTSNKEFLKPAEPTYCDKLRTVLEFLARSQPPARVEIIERLGNGSKAIDSVPTAIYSFLYATKNEMLPEMTTMIKSPVLRSIFHAISLGGEADTLASMSGAIAGAYWGYSQIPNEILRVCEGSHEILKLADELFNMIFKSKIETSGDAFTRL